MVADNCRKPPSPRPCRVWRSSDSCVSESRKMSSTLRLSMNRELPCLYSGARLRRIDQALQLVRAEAGIGKVRGRHTLFAAAAPGVRQRNQVLVGGVHQILDCLATVDVAAVHTGELQPAVHNHGVDLEQRRPPGARIPGGDDAADGSKATMVFRS